jgi:hypothetical protein
MYGKYLFIVISLKKYSSSDTIPLQQGSEKFGYSDRRFTHTDRTANMAESMTRFSSINTHYRCQNCRI